MEERLVTLLSELRRYTDRDRQIREEKFQRGENFNIFNVLGLSTNETRLHSAFLAELLDPKGSHGCGSGFLTEFMNRFVGKDFLFDALSTASIDIERAIGFKNEDETEGGRIDIVITIDKHMTIVENKIYAVDQKNQLLRYKNYAQSCVDKKLISDYKLLYLTLDGKPASEESTSGTLKENRDYSTISYEKDILNWLIACKSIAVDKPLIRETITQYINLLKNLTNQDMDSLQKEQMFTEMAKYPDVVASIFHVGFSEFRNFLFDKFCDKQFETEACKREGLVYEKRNALSGEKESGFCFSLKEWKHARLWISTENYDHDFYVGVSFDGLKEEDLKGKVDICPILQKKPSIWWPIGWELLQKYQNWNNSSIIPAFTSGNYVKYIMEVVDDILYRIKENNVKLI